MRKSLTISCPAKVNLALAVDQPRPSDGLHPICSWMMTVDLVDDCELTQLETGMLSRYAILWHEDAQKKSDIDWPIVTDLAVRAHLALEQHIGRELPIQMKLEKRIPVGAGLGGGSSNAAAMLRGLNALFELDIADEELRTIAATLGSDVPFLMSGGSATVSGVGEHLQQHATTPGLAMTLVLPYQSCSTAAVYRAFDRLKSSPEFDLSAVETLVNDAQHGSTLPGSLRLFNHLAEPALAVEPELIRVRDEISAIAERAVHVTGSGSAMFVVCDNRIHAEALERTIHERLEIAAIAVESVDQPEVVA